MAGFGWAWVEEARSRIKRSMAESYAAGLRFMSDDGTDWSGLKDVRLGLRVRLPSSQEYGRKG